jgi:hypothetical protein
MLAKNTSLKRIDLRWNNLGASGGKALLEGLQRNGSMIELMLAGNKVTDDTLRAVDHHLHKVKNSAPMSCVLAACAEVHRRNVSFDERACAESRPRG